MSLSYLNIVAPNCNIYQCVVTKLLVVCLLSIVSKMSHQKPTVALIDCNTILSNSNIFSRIILDIKMINYNIKYIKNRIQILQKVTLN